MRVARSIDADHTSRVLDQMGPVTRLTALLAND